jgi:mannose-1-phosphate guanylyltransferase
MKLSVVIMAGGVGSRFWPESRERKPKQLLEVVIPGRTLIQATLDRTAEFAPLSDTLVITSDAQREELAAQIPELPPENIITEPFGRNTATCVALAEHLLSERLGPDTVMAVLPADHIIRNQHEFTRLMRLGARLAFETRGLITVGIHPSRPETGYGYIQLDDEHLPGQKDLPEFSEFELRDVFRVKRFAEKPDIGTARRFVESGDFLWNSGMFLWRLDAINAALREYTPEITEQMELLPPFAANGAGSDRFAAKLKEAYSCIRGVSIDYGVMERAANVYVLRAGAIGWSDVGSWEEVYRLSEKDLDNNVLLGPHVVARNARSSLVVSRNDQLIALYGVSDMIVVNCGDAILITRRDQAQGVRDVVDYLKRHQMTEFL